MSVRPWIFVGALVVVALGGLVLLDPQLVGLSKGGATASSGTGDPRRYSFVQSVNDLGDRILLTTGASITLTPQPTGPDRVAIAASGGDKQGTFRFTIVPHQGSRGVRRAIGEFETNGQVFRLCEVVDDPAGNAPIHAERFAPVNNGGARYALPTPIPATTFGDLITSAVNGTRAGARSTSFAPSAETSRLAETMIGLCAG